ncbi:MAG: hypothetical protein KJ077_10430 [Anaerolineae bacterium]|nr:hypothetical protein [Anaerolineae bacterium]
MSKIKLNPIITDIDFNNTIIPYDPRIANQTLTTTEVVGNLQLIELVDVDEIEDREVFTRKDFFDALEKVSTPTKHTKGKK